MISLAGEQLIQQHETKFALNNVILSTAAGCMGRFPALGLQHYQMSNRLDHRFSKLGEIHQIGKYIRSTRAHHGHHGLFTWHYIIMIVHFPFLCSKNRSVSGRHHPRSDWQVTTAVPWRHPSVGGRASPTVASPMVIQPAMEGSTE